MLLVNASKAKLFEMLDAAAKDSVAAREFLEAYNGIHDYMIARGYRFRSDARNFTVLEPWHVQSMMYRNKLRQNIELFARWELQQEEKS